MGMGMNRKIHFIARYASALAFVAAACIIRYVIVHLVGDDFPTWITFYPAIMLVALMFGFGPGILSILSAVLASCTFFPRASFGINNAVSIGFFVAVGVFISAVGVRFRRTQKRQEDLLAKLRQTNDELRRENSERKRVEEQLSANVEKLRCEIAERKKLEQQLLQSQKMESVGILAGGVAHDFNNLLTAISGYGQILLESIPEDDELSQESITNVLKAAEQAAELTRGLLAFSRKQIISPNPLHIDTLISDTVKLIERIIGEDIELSTNFLDKNLVVNADPGQIEQILMNLATNARDAMPNGGHLSITTRQAVVEEGSETLHDLPSPGKYAQISVADTGTGIDKNALGKIFEPFFTTKEVGMGTGLGLSIVHGVIKQHNGSIIVNSELGKGTALDIYLPLDKGHVVKKESKIATRHYSGTETLLVAEDDDTVRMFMKKILERAGYKVIVANDGEDAVKRFREHDDISLVLSDVVMPKINGREMLDEIKKIKAGIKAVFISGYATDIMQKKGPIEAGTRFITKPFKKEDLLQTVREVLEG